MFLNITPAVTNWTSDNKQFSLVFDENPLADFVELPDDGRAQNELWYSNILCGVLRGALEMVSVLPIRRERLAAAQMPAADKCCRFKCKWMRTSLATFFAETTLQR